MSEVNESEPERSDISNPNTQELGMCYLNIFCVQVL